MHIDLVKNGVSQIVKAPQGKVSISVNSHNDDWLGRTASILTSLDGKDWVHIDDYRNPVNHNGVVPNLPGGLYYAMSPNNEDFTWFDAILQVDAG
ncbi:MAG: hypothetical protein AAF802_01805 [Planctomycetota bacterium]